MPDSDVTLQWCRSGNGKSMDVMAHDGVATVKLHVADVIGSSDRRGWGCRREGL